MSRHYDQKLSKIYAVKNSSDRNDYENIFIFLSASAIYRLVKNCLN